MTELDVRDQVHPDLQVAHATPGRLRLRAPRLMGNHGRAEAVGQRLAAIEGVHRATADPTTGSVTIHYHLSALKSVEFFAEVAAALGLVATGLDPGAVEAMFQLLGVSPAALRAAWGDGAWPMLAVPIAFFALGFAVGRGMA